MTTFIILGATGDLSRRKLIPAIYRLVKNKKISKFAIVGCARSNVTAEDILNASQKFINKLDKGTWNRMLQASYYQSFDFYNKNDFTKLGSLLNNVEKKHQLDGNRLFYLATLPEHFDTVTYHLADTGIAKENQGQWSRVVYEKPFGQDLKSAKKINKYIARVFKENQVFRIDHYLGKELVGNIVLLRFTNRVLEPLWNSEHIDSVQIIANEKIDIEGRGNFYDRYGALKDFVQSHMIQMMALIAMEPPAKITGESIREEKSSVLKRITVADVLLGQYKGYKDEKGVNKNSITETFAVLKLFINNKRWKDVPFFLKTGKNLYNKETIINIKFKGVECLLTSCPIDTNNLTIRVQPDEGFALGLFAKVPGKFNEIMPVKMDYLHECVTKFRTPEAYQILLEDILKGDQTLFVRNDEIESAWKVIESIKEKKSKIYQYEPGSHGPEELSLFEKKHNMKWRA